LGPSSGVQLHAPPRRLASFCACSTPPTAAVLPVSVFPNRLGNSRRRL